MIKKTFILFFLFLLIASASAISLGNEIEDSSINPGSFKMMSNPELDSELFLQFQLIGADSNGLDSYHTELTIYDNRGVLVYPRKSFTGPYGIPNPGFLGEIAFADSNGIVNYSVFLPSCGFFSDGEFCFQLQQEYTVTITGKGLLREETFVTQLKQIETNWVGDFLRFVTVNSQGIFILLLSFIVSASLITLILKRRKHGN